MKKIGLLLFAGLMAAPALAQDDGLSEVVVTGQRASADYFDDSQTVIGLRRRADSAVQPVNILSDSRDPEMRKQEIRTMVRSAIDRAKTAGLELVTGDFELVPLNAATLADLAIANDNRPDSSKASFFVKARLASGTGDAQQRIDAFVKAVPATGRATMEKRGDLTLTIINPDQYRDQVVKLVAAEGVKYASFFGADYGVDVSGLNEQLAWAQVSGSEVFLYIPYRFTIRPK